MGEAFSDTILLLFRPPPSSSIPIQIHSVLISSLDHYFQSLQSNFNHKIRILKDLSELPSAVMPRSKREADAPKPDKAKWTDLKIRFVLNEFLSEKEEGNMLGNTWKHVAYVNVTSRYNLAYPKEPLELDQIKNQYSTQKGTYMSMRRVKDLSGIGWVGGRIDMPDEWWDDIGKEMDALLHSTNPTGALRTGTSSGVRVMGKNPEGDGMRIGLDDDQDQCANGSTQEGQSLDEDHHLEQDDDDDDEVQILGVSDESVNMTVNPIPASSNPSVSPISTTNRILKSTATLNLRGIKSKLTDDLLGIDDIKKEVDEPGSKPSIDMKKIKGKQPAREVKPGTLANAIASASKDSLAKANAALERDKQKDARSAELAESIKEAARIKAERLPHLQRALDIFNLDSQNRIPDINDRVIAINIISDESKSAVFAGLDDTMRWAWLAAEVVSKKGNQNIQ
ncbi:hypothetical protein DFH28DRAFT_1136190 [Melampsora americana]|nr:hypothetical protein DFH28DRAFT_1136190 [Melampsora americana]